MVPAGSAADQLSDEHRRGLTALAAAGCISLACTGILFVFLTFKLFQSGLERRRRRRRRRRHPAAQPKPPLHLVPGDTGSLGAAGALPATAAAAALAGGGDEDAADDSNPFPILIYNMLLVHMSDAVASSLNVAWLAQGRIAPGTPTCWAQGWFHSNGKLGASAFLSAISVLSYLTVARGCKPSPRAVRAVIAALWVFVHFTSAVGIVATRNGKAHGGWYGRANGWCWISDAYEPWRFWTHYFWIVFCVPLSLGLNVATALTLWRENRSSRHLPFRRTAVLTGGGGAGAAAGAARAPRPSGHHPAFFVYPILSGLIMMPLLAARLHAMGGGRPSVTWFCAAAAAVTCNGLCDVLLWVSTMVLASPQAQADAGLARFQFLRTDPTAYGNIVWIGSEAGAHDGEEKKKKKKRGGRAGKAPAGVGSHPRWWSWNDGGKIPTGRCGRRGLRHGRGLSEESLRRGVLEESGIQMNVVTTVVVEHVVDEAEIRDSSEFSGKDLGSLRSSGA